MVSNCISAGDSVLVTGASSQGIIKVFFASVDLSTVELTGRSERFSRQ